MKVWIDTEFNGYRGNFDSLTLVDENNRHFYECVACASPDPWVKEHVIPVLNRQPILLSELQLKLETFLQPYNSVHLIAERPDDIRHFCDLLITGPGTRINTPTLTMEIRRDLDGAVSKTPHNALEDAIAIKAEFLRLTPFKVPKTVLLHDESLRGIDPDALNLTDEQQCRIGAECRVNLQYFTDVLLRHSPPIQEAPSIDPKTKPIHLLFAVNSFDKRSWSSMLKKKARDFPAIETDVVQKGLGLYWRSPRFSGDSSYVSAVIIELIHGSFYDHDSFKNLHDMLMFQHVNTPEVLPVFVITASIIHFETRVRNYKKMYPNGYSKTKMRFVHLTSILPKISLESQLTLRTQKVLLELRTLSQ